jgi:AP endonuclease-2
VCTYVDSRYCVPLKAEEGITGLLLDDKGSTMSPPWTPEERIGGYPEMDDLHLMDEANGMTFDPKRLDMEGRAVVCDFGSAKTAEWAPASRLYQPVRPVQPLLAQRN